MGLLPSIESISRINCRRVALWVWSQTDVELPVLSEILVILMSVLFYNIGCYSIE